MTSFDTNIKREMDMITELIMNAMKQDKITVRVLAKKAGLSPTIIQDLKSGKRSGISLKSFLKIIQVLECDFAIERDGVSF
jgi:DNA-binding Xre family transcriptional regulator